MSRHDRLPVCILAGGLGTRLYPHTRQVPKALVHVAGRPFVMHQLEQLARHGTKEVVFCLGHLGEMIEAALGPEFASIRLSYSYDAPGLSGTLGAVRRALPLLGRRFLVLYGDTYLAVDFAAVGAAFVSLGSPALMTVWRNDNALGASNARFDGEFVTAYDKRHPSPEMAFIDYGLSGLSPEALAEAAPEESDLSGLFKRLAELRLLRGYEVHERFHEIGSPEALAETDAFLRSAPARAPAPG